MYFKSVERLLIKIVVELYFSRGTERILEIKIRNLNKQEQYACSVKDIKTVFGNEDAMFVSFGFLGRKFNFDSACKKCPSIEGIIISSLQISRRLNITNPKPIFSFYAIRDDKYTDKNKEIFVNGILPMVYEWYQKTISMSDTSVSGIEELLIEWNGIGFKMHGFRFA